jgi:predicted phosphodiesterase
MVNKILFIGDIHGRLIWKDIIEKENPDLTIFLGDYVSTHEGISANQQLSNLEDILNYKKDNIDKVILLRGNHDCQMLGYSWAECSGYDPEVFKYMSESSFRERFLKFTQWVYLIPDTNIICSHAGISTKFLENVNNYKIFPKEWRNNPNIINYIKPCELFGFTPCKLSDYTGISATQPCTWIRPQALIEYGIPYYIQIVGHTPVKEITNITNDNINIWLCDCLDNKQYLILENGEFKSYKF